MRFGHDIKCETSKSFSSLFTSNLNLQFTYLNSRRSDLSSFTANLERERLVPRIRILRYMAYIENVVAKLVNLRPSYTIPDSHRSDINLGRFPVFFTLETFCICSFCTQRSATRFRGYELWFQAERGESRIHLRPSEYVFRGCLHGEISARAGISSRLLTYGKE